MVENMVKINVVINMKKFLVNLETNVLTSHRKSAHLRNMVYSVDFLFFFIEKSLCSLVFDVASSSIIDKCSVTVEHQIIHSLLIYLR